MICRLYETSTRAALDMLSTRLEHDKKAVNTDQINIKHACALTKTQNGSANPKDMEYRHEVPTCESLPADSAMTDLKHRRVLKDLPSD